MAEDPVAVSKDAARPSPAWARGPMARGARRVILRGVIGPPMWLFGHPKVRGIENLQSATAPMIFAANHSSHMDTPAILLSLPPKIRSRTLVVAAADYFYRNRLVGGVVSLSIGTIPLDRERGGAESLQAVKELLAQGWSIVAFPEGTRSRDGRLYRGKTGIARIALEAHVPVLPIGLKGTFEALPYNRRMPRRAEVEVRFGAPLWFDRLYDRPTDRFALRSATDEIMYEIMMLSDREYVDQYGHKAKVEAASPPPAPPSEVAPSTGASQAQASSSDQAAGSGQ